MEMTMGKIKREDLLSLEAYYIARPEMRLKAIAERKKRTVILGEHLNMIFENKYLMQYQIQEMLRVEKIFEDEGIQDEMDTYNALVPDGTNFKVTMKLEYVNEADRKIALSKLIGIEHRVFVEVEGQARVYAIANEDLDRTTADKTSSVHFLRFELTQDMIKSLKAGAQLKVGCDHKEYPSHVESLPAETLASFLEDLV